MEPYARPGRSRKVPIGHRAVVCANPENAEFAQVMIEPERVLFEVRVRQVDRPYVQGMSQGDHRIRVKSATLARSLLMWGQPLS